MWAKATITREGIRELENAEQMLSRGKTRTTLGGRGFTYIAPYFDDRTSSTWILEIDIFDLIACFGEIPPRSLHE